MESQLYIVTLQYSIKHNVLLCWAVNWITVSFLVTKVDFTFDKNVMSEILKECRDLLLKLVDKHLTTKSHGRINHVFSHYSNPELLASLYSPNGPFSSNLTKICTGLNKLLEDDKLWADCPAWNRDNPGVQVQNEMEEKTRFSHYWTRTNMYTKTT